MISILTRIVFMGIISTIFGERLYPAFSTPLGKPNSLAIEPSSKATLYATGVAVVLIAGATMLTIERNAEISGSIVIASTFSKFHDARYVCLALAWRVLIFPLLFVLCFYF